MATSLQDQLLQAGIVTEEQVQNVENEKKSQRQKRFKAKKKQTQKKTSQTKPQSDLEKFYKQRTALEKKERKESREAKLAEKKLKKERHEKVCKLIHECKSEIPEGDIRFNFAIGNNIKYIFINETQQEKLSNGELAITFLKGKKVLIPAATAADINIVDPNKIVILLQ
ncbi:MAG TPA: DUF2058 family protein [Leucothrix sp.]|nr:DUF2058 family protein [Leucothrix sp.]